MADDAPARASSILNVDDDEANRYAVSRILRHAGYTVAEASTGQEALATAAKLRPDLVVLDIQLPDLDGFEVARRLREIPALAHTPVVHLTAHATSAQQRVTGLEGGAAAYLTRPLETRELLATIASLVGLQRAEQRARRVAREWQATFDAIPHGIYLLDERGRLVRTNAALCAAARGLPTPIVGRAHEEVLGAVLGRALAAGERVDVGAITSRLERDLDGAEHVFRWTLDPVRDEVEAVIGTVGILVDVTERRRLATELARRNEALELADRRKDEFLAMLAHELRNPLGAIAAAAMVLQQEVTPGDVVGARVRETVRRQTAHLARLVDDLLDVSRINEGKIELRREPIDLGDIVDRAALAQQPVLEARGHELEVVHPEGVRVPVEVDAVRIEQALVNLLDNAGKFTERAGHVRLELDVDRELAVVRVVDDGRGLPADRLESVFDAFVQIDPTFDRARGGLGLGLTLVRRLVELHGGTVRAYSEGPGRGASFEIRLPLVLPRGAQASSGGPQRGPDAERGRVLLVEDNDDNRMMLRFLVEHAGHEVIEAPDGAQGVELALRERPELAVIDLGLPELDGFEVARRIRAGLAGAPMHLVALTGYGTRADRERALAAGFDEHVLKPVEPERLHEVLARLGPRLARGGGAG